MADPVSPSMLALLLPWHDGMCTFTRIRWGPLADNCPLLGSDVVKFVGNHGYLPQPPRMLCFWRIEIQIVIKIRSRLIVCAVLNLFFKGESPVQHSFQLPLLGSSSNQWGSKICSHHQISNCTVSSLITLGNTRIPKLLNNKPVEYLQSQRVNKVVNKQKVKFEGFGCNSCMAVVNGDGYLLGYRQSESPVSIV